MLGTRHDVSVRFGICLVAIAHFACSVARSESVREQMAASAEQPPPAQLAPDRRSSGVEPARVAPDKPVQLATPYARGRWRLAGYEAMYDVLLWPSHILIRHRDVDDGLVSFHLPEWTGAPDKPARSRAEAYRLAEQLAADAQRAPETFARLARVHSEDIATRDAGGSLGGVDAALLLRWPAVLDALASISPGQVSRAVETEYGFHIFTRRTPPLESNVSGSRIVIGYDRAAWLGLYLARRPIPPRSREEARVLANSIYERARQNPSEFERLVDEYSEHEDAARAGDIGAWSTRESTPFPREVELLQRLAVGEIAPPLDSDFGFEIIRRTAERRREAYAMTLLEQGFDPKLPESEPGSKAAALRLIQAQAETLALHPERFEEVQKAACCANVLYSEEGRELTPIDLEVLRLAPGQISKQPLQLQRRHVIVKRLPFAALPRPNIQFELPQPKQADLARFASRDGLGERMLERVRHSVDALKLPSDVAQRLLALHDIDGQLARDPSMDARRAVFLKLLDDVEELLREHDYPRYVSILDRYLEGELL
jgi:hypothetical protein